MQKSKNAVFLWIDLLVFFWFSDLLFHYLFNKYYTGNEDKGIHVRLLLSNGEAGAIIGKGGATINQIKSQSGARVQLSRNNEYFPGTTDRIIMVSGAVEDILKAADLILSRLLDEVSDMFSRNNRKSF